MEKKRPDLIRRYFNGNGEPVILEIVRNDEITGTKDWSLWLETDPVGDRLTRISGDDTRLSALKFERNEFAKLAGFKRRK